MGKEQYLPSSEEMSKIEKERTISDADLLKKGAEYAVDEEGNKKLEVTNNQINDIEDERERESERERQRLLYEHIQEQGLAKGDEIKVNFLPGGFEGDASEGAWRYISSELTRHGIKTGDERIFYLTTEPIHPDCIIASVVPIEQLEGMTEKEMRENLVSLWYHDIESVKKVEN